MAFAPGPPMASARLFCATVTVDAQHVLVIGGQDSGYSTLASTELLDVAMLEFAAGPALRAARSACGSACAARLGAAGDRVIVLGSGSETEVLAADDAD
jgi:hypothetical protein